MLFHSVNIRKLVAKIKIFYPIFYLNEANLTPLVIPIWSLKIKGLFIIKSASTRYISYCIVMHLVFTEINLLAQLIHVLSIKSFVQLTKVLSTFPSFICAFMEDIVILTYINEFLDLIHTLRMIIHEHGMSTNSRNRLDFITKFHKFYMVQSALALVVTMVAAPFFHDFGYPMWTPFDSQYSHLYWLTYLYQTSLVLVVGCTSVGVILLPSIFMAYTLGFLEQLCAKLENRKTGDNKKTLIDCIKFHLQICELNEKVQKLFSFTLLLRRLLTSVILCTTIFLLITFAEGQMIFKYVTYSFNMLIAVAIPSFYGSQITEMSSKITNCLFHSDWMYEGTEYRKIMKIAMEVSKRPLRIQVAGVVDVNLQTFLGACKSTYSLYTICKRLNEL
jgi:hypothetical protein